MEVNCTPTQFESALKTLCERMGLLVQLTQASHDGGVDLNVIDLTPIRGGRYIVQAKRYRSGVGEPIIRDLYGTLLHSGAVKAILITTGYFTEGAVAFAYGKPIELVDGDALGRLIDQYRCTMSFQETRFPRTPPVRFLPSQPMNSWPNTRKSQVTTYWAPSWKSCVKRSAMRTL